MANDPFREAEDHFEEMADQLEAQYDATMMAAAGADVLAELKGGGPLFVMLELARKEAAAEISKLTTIDAGDVAAVRQIQASIAAYQKLTGFAVLALRGNKDANADSGVEAVDDLLPGAEEAIDDFIGRVGAGEDGEG